MKWHRAVALDLLLVRQILMNSNNLYWKRFNDCWLRGVYQWQNLVFSCSFFMIWSIRQLSLLRCSRSNWICSDENYNLSDNCWGNIKIKQIESYILHLVCTFLSTVSCVRIYRWWKTSFSLKWNRCVYENPTCTQPLSLTHFWLPKHLWSEWKKKVDNYRSIRIPKKICIRAPSNNFFFILFSPLIITIIIFIGCCSLVFFFISVRFGYVSI